MHRIVVSSAAREEYGLVAEAEAEGRMSMGANGRISVQFFNFVSQMAHWATMGFLSLSASVLWGTRGLEVVVPAGLVYAAWHEFWYDPRYENRATRGSDVEDFLFLCGGLALGTGVYFLARHLGRI